MTYTTRRVGTALWIVQALLAALFVFAGGFKLTLPSAELAAATGLPGPFMTLVSVCEVAGAIGLVLPGLLGIRTELTSLAAAGLVGIMAGATTLSLTTMGIQAAALPILTGLLAGLVAVGRREPREPEHREPGVNVVAAVADAGRRAA